MSRLIAWAGVAAVALLAGCGGAGPEDASTGTPTTTASPGEGDPASAAPGLASYVEVGDDPVGITAQDDSVWVVSSGADEVSRIPAGGSGPDLVVDVPGTPLRAVAAAGAVWVTAFRGQQLLRIDAATG